MYKKFAYIYDELMDEVNYEEWFKYIDNIFKKFNKNPKNILEMACGTGNLSHYLARAGYDLYCFDISNDMLSIAYNKLKGFNNVKLFNQNMIDFNLNKKFDGIISICDSINYILDKDKLLQTFRNVKKHLEDDGIFIFDINSYYKLSKIIGDNIFLEDREDIYYVWENFFDKENSIASFFLTFFVKDKGESYIRFDETHTEKAYKIEEILDLLKKAQFSKIHIYDEQSFEKPHTKSERITFVVMV